MPFSIPKVDRGKGGRGRAGLERWRARTWKVAIVIPKCLNARLMLVELEEDAKHICCHLGKINLNLYMRSWYWKNHSSVQVSSFPSFSRVRLCDPMDCSTPGSSVFHCLPQFPQIHLHWVSNAIQPSHPLSSSSSPALSLSQHQGLSQWVGSLHQVAKVLELQLQHQPFQWTFRSDFL